MKSQWIILFGLFLSGCSPQARLARLVEHHPELARPDTLEFHDTLKTREVLADTAVCIERLTDTLCV